MNLDAYTVRKIAPRLFFAVVGVNLSIYLCVAAVDITSVVGHGLAYLIRAPFDTSGALHSTVDAGAANVAAPLLVVGLLAAVVTLKGATGAVMSTIFFILIPVFVLILTTLITLAIRQALLVLLTLISPVAIVLAVLPGTEKYFKQWWDLFLKTLIAYPIIAALFAVSDVLTAISFSGSNVGSNTAGATDVISGLLYAFMPFVMIPFAFRMSGGALGGFFNATQAMRSAVNRWGLGGLQKNFTEGLNTVQAQGLFRKTGSKPVGEDAEGNVIYSKTLRSRFNKGTAMLANMHEFSPSRPIRSLGDATQRAIAARAVKYKDSDRAKMLAGYDDELYALIDSNGTTGDIKRALRERVPKRFDDLAAPGSISDAERAKRTQDLNAATSTIQEYIKGAGGATTAKAAAAVELHGISTSYRDKYYLKDENQPDHIARDSEGKKVLWDDSKHDVALRGEVAETSEHQMQRSIMTASGGMRGLGNWITVESIKGAKQAGRYDLAASASAVVMYQEAMRSGDKEAIEKMQDYYDKMMVDRITPAQATQGHPRAAEGMANALKKRLGQLEKDFESPDLKLNPEGLKAKNEEYARVMADIAGYQDALSSAGSEAVSYFDDLMGQKFGSQTVGEHVVGLRNNKIFNQRRREYAYTGDGGGRRVSAAERAAGARAAADAAHIERPDPTGGITGIG